MAIMFMVLLAFVGLATDAAILYATYGQLRRGVDAAALSAATQIREARTIDEVTKAARSFLQLQGFQPADITSFSVETCDSLYGSFPTSYSDPLVAGDRAICTYPVRKLVRVSATVNATFAFMRLFGWSSVPLRAVAVSEAAALDIMLVIDTSYSMSFDASLTNAIDDDYDGCADEAAGAGCDANAKADDWLGSPSSGNGIVDINAMPPDTWPNCNDLDAHDPTYGLYGYTYGVPPSLYLPPDYTPPAPYDSLGVVSPVHSCRPFEWVRDAAMKFVTTFVNFPYDRVGIVTFANTAVLVQSLGDTAAATITDTVTALNALDVSASPPCHGNAAFKDTVLPNWLRTEQGAIGACEATNTGDALKLAIQNLNANPRSNGVRFIILLSDGAASSSAPDAAQSLYYACPQVRVITGTSTDERWDPMYSRRACQDGDSRNYGTYRHASTDPNYDADDYAKDQADVISLAGNTVMFTIGLGNEVTFTPGVGSITIKGVPITQRACDPTQPPGTVDFNVPPGAPSLLGPCNMDQRPNGEQLLRYIADKGDGINTLNADPCSRDDNAASSTYTLYLEPIGQSCGNYFYAQGGLDLEEVFSEIAQRIFTRLTQ